MTPPSGAGEPEFLEPLLQDEGMMGFGPDSMGGGLGRGLMRGGMRGQGRMGYMTRGGPLGKGPFQGVGGGGAPMMPMDGPLGGPSFRPGMGPRGGSMEAGPGGRFGGRGLGPSQGPAWGPRGSFPPENGLPGATACNLQRVCDIWATTPL